MSKTQRPLRAMKTRAREDSKSINAIDLADRLTIQIGFVDVIRYALIGLQNEAEPNTTGLQELCYSHHDALREIVDLLAPAPEVGS